LLAFKRNSCIDFSHALSLRNIGKTGFDTLTQCIKVALQILPIPILGQRRQNYASAAQ
jgi:hypothetical protein